MMAGQMGKRVEGLRLMLTDQTASLARRMRTRESDWKNQFHLMGMLSPSHLLMYRPLRMLPLLKKHLQWFPSLHRLSLLENRLLILLELNLNRPLEIGLLILLQLLLNYPL